MKTKFSALPVISMALSVFVAIMCFFKRTFIGGNIIIALFGREGILSMVSSILWRFQEMLDFSTSVYSNLYTKNYRPIDYYSYDLIMNEFGSQSIDGLLLLLCIVTAFVPLACRGLRKSKTKCDDFFEITALVIGQYNFYSVSALSIDINPSIVIGIIAIICVIYSRIPVVAREESNLHNKDEDLCYEYVNETKRETREGIIRIVIGSMLLLLQLYFFVMRVPYDTPESFEMDCSAGICGVLLLCYGIGAYRLRGRTKYILHPHKDKRFQIIKWFSVAFLTIYLISIIMSVRNIMMFLFSPSALLVGSLITLIVYLIFYIGKKPSYLLSSSLVLAGSAYIIGQSSISSSFVFYYNNYDFSTFLVIILSFVLRLIVGILYIVMAVKLYRGDSKNKWIYKTSWIPIFLLLIEAFLDITNVFITGGWITFIDNSAELLLNFITRLLLPVILFVYTCVVEIDLPKVSDDFRIQNMIFQ